MYFHRTTYLALLLSSFALAGVASAQSLSIVSGDGQLAPQFQVQNPMVVLVTNAQGQPLPGVTVSWSVTGQGNLNTGVCDSGTCTTTTAANGQATNTLVGGQVPAGANYTQTSVTVTIAGQTVTFLETVVAIDPVTGVPLVPIQLLSPQLGDVLDGPAGSTGTTPVVVQIGNSGISGVIHALVRLVPTDPDGPSIACSGTTGYSDVNGSVNCLPVFGGKIGSGQYFVDVGGGFRIYGPFSFTVRQGVFATFRITGGNNQAGTPGSTLALQLTARTEDAAGNPVANVPVVWEAVVPNTITVSNASSASDSAGNVSATAKLGGTPGSVQLRLRNANGSIQALFTFQVNLVVNGISKVAGDNQDAVINTPYTQPLIVQVTTPQGALPGIQVQFNSPGGVTFPNGFFATTDAQGRASINVNAGPTPGSAVVTASVSGFSTTFSLTIRLAGPKVTINSFFNGAGGQPGGVTPTGILTIYGEGLATGLQGCVSANQIIGPLPLLLSNVTVLFASGSYQAYGPMYGVCNLGTGQEYVTLQVPADLQPGVATVTVRVGASQTIVPNVPVTPVSPGIFETVMSDGRKRAVLVHSIDGSYVTLENKARAGERLLAFVTGLGRPVTSKGVKIGTNQGGIPGDDAKSQQQVIVGVADQGVNVVSAIYAPYMIGVYIVTFDVQQSLPSGSDINFAVAASVNDSLVFGNPSKIPIQ